MSFAGFDTLKKISSADVIHPEHYIQSPNCILILLSYSFFKSFGYSSYYVNMLFFPLNFTPDSPVSNNWTVHSAPSTSFISFALSFKAILERRGVHDIIDTLSVNITIIIKAICHFKGQKRSSFYKWFFLYKYNIIYKVFKCINAD